MDFLFSCFVEGEHTVILVIYGAGGLGREVYDTAIAQLKPEWSRIVFVDDFNFDRQLNGVDVVNFSKLVTNVGLDNLKVILGIGEPSVRAEIWERIISLHGAGSDVFTSVVHPTAIISTKCQIGNGVYIGPFSFVSSNVVLEDNVLLQPHTIVGHDSRIGSSSVISPNCTVAGSCQIGQRTYIGMNACVEQGRIIGDDVMIGMTSCVNRDIPSGVIALGIPARVVKNNETKRIFS